MSEHSHKTEAHLAKLRSMGHAKAFLGREFLTWIWYRSETQSEPMHIQSPDKKRQYMIDIWVDDRVTLESATGKAHSHTIKGGDPSQSAEAATALMTGKTPRDMKIGMNIHDFGDFVFTLAGDELNPRSVQLPEPPETLSEEESFSVLAFRISAMEALCEVIDSLFSAFMDERIDQGRNQEFRNEIRQWIEGRPSASESLLH